eukprot:TRINITY_DN8942_c0_g1_i2.p1 TRINITY_DN8942_c0_g1~~TRINITY_DN8942_c0_g1_i2.p1  ORF type:complete len:943 (+),score=231.11 TRINITY_DN8942_c0_g1_i2:117-2945(+)
MLEVCCHSAQLQLINGRAGAFVEVELDGLVVGRTRADIQGGPTPRWEERFSVMSIGRRLSFRAMQNSWRPDEFPSLLGETTVDLRSMLARGMEGQQCLALGHVGRHTGNLYISYRPIQPRPMPSGYPTPSASSTANPAVAPAVARQAAPAFPRQEVPAVARQESNNHMSFGPAASLASQASSKESNNHVSFGPAASQASSKGPDDDGVQRANSRVSVGSFGSMLSGQTTGSLSYFAKPITERVKDTAKSMAAAVKQSVTSATPGMTHGGKTAKSFISTGTSPVAKNQNCVSPTFSSPIRFWRNATSTSETSQSTPLQSSTTPKRLSLSQEGVTTTTELMQNSDKMKAYAAMPFRGLPPGSLLGFDAFKHALKRVLKELHMSIPQEQQMRQLFDKHRHGTEGIGEEEFEALLFRLLCFLRASAEVQVQTGTASAEGERDKKWRQEFIQRNSHLYSEVYDQEKQLGKGSFGRVFLVKHRTQRDAENALRIRVSKVISKEKALKAGTTEEKVREEFEVLKALDHPHVLRIFETFEDAENFYLIMEPCRGGDLLEYTKTLEPMDAITYEQWVAKVLQHVLSALAYCHSKSVIHKDLKPENVMLSTSKGTPIEEMHVVVVDFGLAEMFDNPDDRSKVISGTPPYMAPEVWAGNFSKSCDIWSVGCMMFFLLSGRLPFLAKKVEDFPQAVQKEPEWQLMGGATAEAMHFCKSTLKKQEAERPTARDALKDAWFVRLGVDVNGGLRTLSQPEIQSLLSVNDRTPFQKFVERLVATQIESSQQKSVNDAFLALDQDGDGMLSREELREGLAKFAVNPNHLDQVIDDLDIGKTGSVSYSEFLAGVINLRGMRPEEQDKLLWVAWQQFLPDEDGRVKTSSIQEALATRGMTVANLPEEFLDALSQQNSGYLEFDAFKKCLLSDSSGTVIKSLSEDKARGGKLMRWMMRRFTH